MPEIHDAIVYIINRISCSLYYATNRINRISCSPLHVTNNKRKTNNSSILTYHSLKKILSFLKKKKVALNRFPCHHQPRDRIPPCCFPPQRHSPALATPAEVTGETPTHQRQKPLLGTGTADRAVIRHRPNTLLTLSEFSYRVTERKGAGSVAENDISILSFYFLASRERTATACETARGAAVARRCRRRRGVSFLVAAE